jgi:hypothetical protein
VGVSEGVGVASGVGVGVLVSIIVGEGTGVFVWPDADVVGEMGSPALTVAVKLCAVGRSVAGGGPPKAPVSGVAGVDVDSIGDNVPGGFVGTLAAVPGESAEAPSVAGNWAEDSL